MKKHNDQFEKNIARLVKSTREPQIPSEAFTNNLIDEALQELQPKIVGRQKRSTIMKQTTKTLIAVAACLAIVSGILAFIMMPSLSKVKKIAMPASSSEKDSHLVVSDQPTEESPLFGAAPEYALIRKSPPPPAPPASSVRRLPAPKQQLTNTIMKENPDKMSIVISEPVQPIQMAHGGTTPPNGEDVDAMFFKTFGVNPFVDTEDDHLSTFAIDVDTGSYAVCRRYLQDGHLPPKEAVRVEEFVNYFSYNYPAPREDAFAVFFEAMPWQFGQERKNTHLMRIGLKAREIPDEYRKPAVLTFVIDVSGSMQREDRLGLVKQSLRLLVDKLRPDDQIGIAVYGSQGRKILPHTGLENKSAILEAIDGLQSEGSTNAEEGIRIGYSMAEQAFVPGSINRVILCSDGVANVGRTGPEAIFETIKSKAEKGITLSALGFGMGNYNDVLMEQLGNKGNGYYAYIDTLDEAKRLFSNLTGALQVVARDVKIQVQFNPGVVRSYRLIGYENRDVADVDFRNDQVDGGEIGAGHATTALYELKLWPDTSGKIATTYIRYKDPDTFEPTEISANFDASQIAANLDDTSDSFALASVVTEFAEILRQSYWAKDADLQDTLTRANQLNALREDPDVRELIDLITVANALLNQKQTDNDTPEPAAIQYEK